MKDTLEQLLQCALNALQKSGEIPSDAVVDIQVMRTKDLLHGDYSTNMALVMGHACTISPTIMAANLVQALPDCIAVEKIVVSKAGFINFFIRAAVRTEIIRQILALGYQRTQKPYVFACRDARHISKCQNAYARCSTVLRQLDGQGLLWDESIGLAYLDTLYKPQERDLVMKVCGYHDALGDFGHLVKFLHELTDSLILYLNGVSLWCEQESLRCARLSLLKAVRLVLFNGLTLLGISAPESV